MLYLVGTPIGKMDDITQRAVQTLQQVDIVACEDTRRTGLLLHKLGISKPLVSYYKHKEQEGAHYLVQQMSAGKNVALVSDAGMPCISDPGGILVRLARQNGINIAVVPGPTALTSALCLCGINTGFVFLGFLPEKKTDKDKLLVQYVTSPLPIVLYCASHDIEDTFGYLHDKLGDRTVYVAKELTKVYESVVVTDLGHAVDFDTHGEFVLIVEGKAEDDSTRLTIEEHVLRYIRMGMDKKQAVKQTAKDRGVPKDVVYKAALEIQDEE